MLYLSKGIAEKDSTENLIKVRRGDYTYTVSGNAAKLWLAGRFGFAACDTDEEIREALETACAYEFVKKLPDEIETTVGEKGSGLSEGQAQRLAIARALLKNAPVLILDEATSALDIETEERVLKNIMKKDRGRTCIVTTHRPSVLSVSDHIYEIRESNLKKLK